MILFFTKGTYIVHPDILHIEFIFNSLYHQKSWVFAYQIAQFYLPTCYIAYCAFLDFDQGLCNSGCGRCGVLSDTERCGFHHECRGRAQIYTSSGSDYTQELPGHKNPVGGFIRQRWNQRFHAGWHQLGVWSSSIQFKNDWKVLRI